MKNIALLTFHSSQNYGAVLQTYATCRIFRELGGDIRLIDLPIDDRLRGPRRLISLPVQWKFSRFRKRYYPQKTRSYSSLAALQADPPVADIYVVGSDQVWNPEITRTRTEAFFLNFGPKSVRRTSYASSFGTDHWQQNESITRKVRSLLSRFDTLSTREKSGTDICRKTFGLPAVHVLDPTLLHRDYTEITGPLQPEKTLVCFKFVQSAAFDRAALHVAKQLGLKPVMLGRILKKNPGFQSIRQPSIRQWIKSIAQSEFVITDSFHGMAFCILYHKNFIVLPSYPGRIGRIKNLLSLLGLESRLCEDTENLFTSDLHTTPIDYTEVDRRLETLRIHSLNYIRSEIFSA